MEHIGSKKMVEGKSDIQKQPKKFSESLKEWIQVLSIAVVVITGATASYITYNEYIDKKESENSKTYFQTLSYIESGDLIKQKAALFQLVRFKDRYHEITPILIDLLYDRYRKGEYELTDSIINIFMLMKFPIEIVVKENTNRKRPEFSQWVITNLIKKDIGNRLKNVDFSGVKIEGNEASKLNLNNIFIENINLKKSSFVNISFNETSFSDTDLKHAKFENCMFWGSSFIGNTNLKKSIFRNCYLKDCYFSIDLNDTSFFQCEVENLKLSEESLIDRKKLTGINEINDSK